MKQENKQSGEQQRERNKVDANIYIDRAIEMMKDTWRDPYVAGYNGVMSLLQYAKESHAAASPSNQSSPIHTGVVENISRQDAEKMADGQIQLFNGDARAALVDGIIRENYFYRKFKAGQSSGEAVESTSDAIEFSEWVDDNGWWRDEKLWSKTSANWENMTTDELYDQFKEQKSK